MCVIEDMHTSYRDDFIARHAPGDSGPRSIIPYLNTLLDDLVSAETPSDSEYAFVHFYNHTVLIGKR